MNKTQLDAKLKADAKANKFTIEGDFIVFDKTANLSYQILTFFTLGELLTKNPVSSYTKLSKTLLVSLESLRETYGKPININSSYRSPEYNKTVPGATANSLHIKGKAFDCGVPDPEVLSICADPCFKDGEVGIYNWGCHVGVGSPGRWDKRGDTSVTQKVKDVLVNDSNRNYTIYGFVAFGLFLLFKFKRNL